MARDLVTNPCQQQCRWRAQSHERGEEPLFACMSCGSQWVPSQPWAPVDADGSRDPALLAVLEQGARHRKGHS